MCERRATARAVLLPAPVLVDGGQDAAPRGLADRGVVGQVPVEVVVLDLVHLDEARWLPRRRSLGERGPAVQDRVSHLARQAQRCLPSPGKFLA